MKVQKVDIGDAVQYVDEVSRRVTAIVTAIHGSDWENYPPCINIVHVSLDENKKDPNGRQIERASSVQAEGTTTATGRFYRNVK